MAFIPVVEDGEAASEAAALLEADRERMGYVPNYTRLFAHRPAAYTAWRQLVGAVSGAMEPRRYELATIAAARALGSSYCLLAHAKVLADAYYDAVSLRRIVRDHRTAGLDPTDVAVMDLAEKVALDASTGRRRAA